MIVPQRIGAAYLAARRDLLDERVIGGHWVGELASSALSTATAVSALSLVRRSGNSRDHNASDELIGRGLKYLTEQQNADGGWGDTDKSLSNIATTMLVRAAFHLAGDVESNSTLLQGADAYINRHGGIAGLRARYGRDKTFAVPILTNCALAGLVPWREVSPLPFELACLPQGLFRFLRLPVVSYAIPALVAIGQAVNHHRRPRNPIARAVRAASREKSLNVVERMQPASGGFLEAVPLTSFVVMSLASIGRADHPVVTRGVEFLTSSVREDDSWPIDTNLATWNTTLAINALAHDDDAAIDEQCIDWLLCCQHTTQHPFTGAPPGGWGWSDLSGAVPDADDTSGALLALAALFPETESPGSSTDSGQRDSTVEAAALGVRWLMGLQNRDGGWPTFCRGWGALPFDRSAADLTAHAIRALIAWRHRLRGDEHRALAERIPHAIRRGFRYLVKTQRFDGSWIPLWFGNQHDPDEQNPVYGTARVLLAYRDAGRMASPEAQRGVLWLVQAQLEDGGWGTASQLKVAPHRGSSVEETAVAVEALLAAADQSAVQESLAAGLEWLVRAVEQNRHKDCSPIGFYFAKLWYYEKLYPLSFTVGALGQAVSQLLPPAETTIAMAHPETRLRKASFGDSTRRYRARRKSF